MPEQKKPDSPFESIIQNFAYHDFNEVPVFVGIYDKTVLLKEAYKNDKDEEIAAIEAHVFFDVEQGEGVYISTSHSINKSLDRARKDFKAEIDSDNLVFNIEFLGKTEFKGKPFNQFNIGICTLQQYQAFKKK